MRNNALMFFGGIATAAVMQFVGQRDWRVNSATASSGTQVQATQMAEGPDNGSGASADKNDPRFDDRQAMHGRHRFRGDSDAVRERTGRDSYSRRDDAQREERSVGWREQREDEEPMGGRAMRDERSAQSRLDDVLGSETRNAVAKHELIEIIRTTKDRVPLRDALATDAGREPNVGSLVPIQKGRKLVEHEIFVEAAEKVRVFGIELLDIRFKRINYNESVRPKIYDRMISERRQIAERFLSEGNGEAARIRGNRVRDLNKIQSEAYRQVEEIRGVADAKATEIYSKAYNQSPEAAAFYEFTRTMQSYKSIISENTTLILSTGSDLFKFLNGMAPNGSVVPAPPSGDRR